jgi:hypothetical protein
MKTVYSIAIGVVLLASNTASAQLSVLFGPSNYDECILDNMKGVSSDMAARAVAASCRSKFPDAPQETRQKERRWVFWETNEFGNRYFDENSTRGALNSTGGALVDVVLNLNTPDKVTVGSKQEEFSSILVTRRISCTERSTLDVQVTFFSKHNATGIELESGRPRDARKEVYSEAEWIDAGYEALVCN